MRSGAALILGLLLLSSCEVGTVRRNTEAPPRLEYAYPSSTHIVWLWDKGYSSMSTVLNGVFPAEIVNSVSALSSSQGPVLTMWVGLDSAEFLAQITPAQTALKGTDTLIGGLEVAWGDGVLTYANNGLELHIYPWLKDSTLDPALCLESFLQAEKTAMSLERDVMLVLPHMRNGVALGSFMDSMVIQPYTLLTLECKMALKEPFRGILQPKPLQIDGPGADASLNITLDTAKLKELLSVSGMKEQLTQKLQVVNMGLEGFLSDWTGDLSMVYLGEVTKQSEIVDYVLDEETFEMREVSRLQEKKVRGVYVLMGAGGNAWAQELMAAKLAEPSKGGWKLSPLLIEDLYMDLSDTGYRISNVDRRFEQAAAEEDPYGSLKFFFGPVTLVGRFEVDEHGNPLLFIGSSPFL